MLEPNIKIICRLRATHAQHFYEKIAFNRFYQKSRMLIYQRFEAY